MDSLTAKKNLIDSLLNLSMNNGFEVLKGKEASVGTFLIFQVNGERGTEIIKNMLEIIHNDKIEVVNCDSSKEIFNRLMDARGMGFLCQIQYNYEDNRKDAFYVFPKSVDSEESKLLKEITFVMN